MPPKLVACRVSARHPITLAGGAPAVHGDIVDIDPALPRNREHLDAGRLRILPAPAPKPPAKPKPAPSGADSTKETA